MGATYTVSLAARVPQSVGPPTLSEVDRLVVESFSYSDELNRPGTATLNCPIRSLSGEVRERLSNLAVFPSEAWIYRGSALAWAGEVQTLGVSGQTLTLNCVGLFGYAFRMGVTSDLDYSNVDQFTIAKGLINHWQNLAFGHYGIGTSGIGTSGVLRDREYLRDELHNIGTRLTELAEVIDGFDFHVDPSTRALVLAYPQRGANLSDAVFLDRRNIDSASVALSIAPDDLVTDVSATGTRQNSSGDNTITYLARANTSLRASYGRSWAGENVSGVSVTGTLTGHADAYLAARDGVMFQPGVTIVPRPDADVGDFGPGDIVNYSYDAGLGMQTGNFRAAKVEVDVRESGEERIGVAFT